MPPVRWSLTRFVPVAPDAAYAWLTDFREDDHDRPAYRRGAGAKPGGKPSKRSVVSRDGDVVQLRDEWDGRAFDLRVTLDAGTRSYAIEGAKWGYKATWRVEPSPGGARIRVDGEMAPKGLLGLLAPLFAKGMVREMERDLQGHVTDMLHELNPEGQPVE